MKVLIYLDGRHIARVLSRVERILSPDADWLVLHVADTGPIEEAGRAFGGLLGRGPGRERAERQMEHVAELRQEDIRAEVEGWLRENGRAAEVVMTQGRPEREILRVAEQGEAGLIILEAGGELGPRPGPGPGPHHGPGPRPLGPVARFVIDHANCDLLLLDRPMDARG